MAELISIHQFKQLDIRVGEVISVERIPKSDKLLRFVFRVGSEERQILAGMAPFFSDLQALVGLQLPILLNIKPAMFMGYESQGMIIAADVQGRPVFLVPIEDIPAGSIVK